MRSFVMSRTHAGTGKKSGSPSSGSDGGDTNDAGMTSYVSFTAGGRGTQPSLPQSTCSSEHPRSTVVTTANTADMVETFDVYYVLPSSHCGLSAPVPMCRGRRIWDGGGEMTMNERRRPNPDCLLDAVPPTPGSLYTDRRAATLPACLVTDWTSPSLPAARFDHYNVPVSPAAPMYSRPRCACLACSDVAQPRNGVSEFYRHPTTATWRDGSDLYYNSDEVDVDKLPRACSCLDAQTAPARNVHHEHAPQPPLSGHTQATYASTRCWNDYDPVPTPLPLNCASVRFWRRADDTDARYSVPVRLTDSGAVYDNEDTLDREQSRHRGRSHLDAEPAADGRPTLVQSRGDGCIMRLVELRQIRAADDCVHGEDAGRQSGWRSHTAEYRYLVTADRATSNCHPRYHHADTPDVTYVNVPDAHAQVCDTNRWISSDGVPDGKIERYPDPPSTTCESTAQNDDDTDLCQHTVENNDSDKPDPANVPVPNSAVCENHEQEEEQKELEEPGSQRLNVETSVQLSGQEQRSSSRGGSCDTARSRPLASIRLQDAYLLRMSPPPPSQQADGRRRAAYSDPVRWVAAASSCVTTHQRHHGETPTTIRPGTSERPNGLRAPAGNASGTLVGRTAATTCTGEALDKAIRRRNRKCKPSAIRRLQAAKLVGTAVAETAATLPSFEPIFEGVTCSLRVRSASLNDCNSLAKP